MEVLDFSLMIEKFCKGIRSVALYVPSFLSVTVAGRAGLRTVAALALAIACKPALAVIS